MRKALSTLPWVEQASIKPDTTKQRVRFSVKEKKRFNLDEIKEAIEGNTPFKVGKQLQGP